MRAPREGIERRSFLRIFAAASTASLSPDLLSATERSASCEGHIRWVTETMERMQTITPGMTRIQLMQVFTTEGGLLFSALQRNFVSRDCPYFKVSVTLKRGPRHVPATGARDRDFLEEYDDDEIVAISRPYLEFSIKD